MDTAIKSPLRRLARIRSNNSNCRSLLLLFTRSSLACRAIFSISIKYLHACFPFSVFFYDRKLFCHIKGQSISYFIMTSSVCLLPHFGEQRIILLLYKVILFYSFFDPCAEIYTLLLRINEVLQQRRPFSLLFRLFYKLIHCSVFFYFSILSKRRCEKTA